MVNSSKVNEINILCVDDDKLDRKLVIKTIENYSFLNTGRVDGVKNIKESIGLISRIKYDLALIDLQLGDKNLGLKNKGFDLVRHCKKNGIIPIVLTGHNDKELITEAYKSGCFGVFLKGTQNCIENSIKSCMNEIVNNKIQFFINNFYLTGDTETIDNISIVLKMLNEKKSNKTILIYGPDKSGKETLATSLSKYFKSNSNGSKNHVFLNIENTPCLEQEKILKEYQKIKTDQASVVFTSSISPVDMLRTKVISSDLLNILIPSHKIQLKSFCERNEKNSIYLLFFIKNKPSIVLDLESERMFNEFKFDSIDQIKKIAKKLVDKYPNGGIVDKSEFIPKEPMNKFCKSLISNEIYDYAHVHGLKKTLKKIQEDIIVQSYIENSKKFRETERAIKVSPTTLSSVIKKRGIK